jgi:hypothetical protein
MLENAEVHDLQVSLSSGIFGAKESESSLVKIFGPITFDRQKARHVRQVFGGIVRQNLKQNCKTIYSSNLLPFQDHTVIQSFSM